MQQRPQHQAKPPNGLQPSSSSSSSSSPSVYIRHQTLIPRVTQISNNSSRDALKCIHERQPNLSLFCSINEPSRFESLNIHLSQYQHPVQHYHHHHHHHYHYHDHRLVDTEEDDEDDEEGEEEEEEEEGLEVQDKEETITLKESKQEEIERNASVQTIPTHFNVNPNTILPPLSRISNLDSFDLNPRYCNRHHHQRLFYPYPQSRFETKSVSNQSIQNQQQRGQQNDGKQHFQDDKKNQHRHYHHCYADCLPSARDLGLASSIGTTSTTSSSSTATTTASNANSTSFPSINPSN